MVTMVIKATSQPTLIKNDILRSKKERRNQGPIGQEDAECE